MKFTDEQLSRVLSQHASGDLKRYGGFSFAAVGCLLEIAYADREWFEGAPKDCNAVMRAFDNSYEQSWSPEGLINFLESQGVV